MTSLSVEKLFERNGTLEEAIKNETTNEFSREYEDIIETGSKGGLEEKLLAIQFILKFFTFYPHLQLRAIDALFHCCQDINLNIRTSAMIALPSLCKSAKEHTMKVASFLSQLSQLEDTQEHIAIYALYEVIMVDPMVALNGFFEQVASGEDKGQEKCIKFVKEKFLSPGSSVVTKDVQDFIRSKIDALEAGGSMLNDELSKKEEIHSQTGYTGQTKKSSQRSHEQDLQQRLEDGPGLKHQTETLSKQEELKNKLRKYVEYFVSIYEVSLSEYYERLENQTAKPGKWADLVNKGIETVKSGTEGIEVAEVKASTMVGINILQNIISSTGTKFNRDQLKKVTALLYKFKEDPDRVREELVKCGVNIFRSFESQFVEVKAHGSWERALRKLAHDAVNRAMNYYKEHPDEEFSASSITKGVLLGESKTYKHTSTAIPHFKPGHALTHITSKSWNTAEIFNKTGLVTIKCDGSANKYYKRNNRKSETGKYGYRLPFQWESDEVLKKKYQEENPPKKAYNYILNPNEQEKLESDLLDNIQKQFPKVMEESLKDNFKAEIKQIKEDARKSFNELEKYISNNFKDLLRYIEEHQDEIKDMFKSIEQKNERHHQEASQQREEIARNNTDEHKKTQEEVKSANQGINTLKKGQDDIINKIEKIGSKDQDETPIWFDVKEPVIWFTGRTEILKELHEALRNKGEAVISQTAAITGLGGVGKSELARKYISEYSKYYNHNIIWINAESNGTLDKSFRKLAEDKLSIEMKTRDGKKKNVMYIVQDVYKYFSKTQSLFIFDNAEKYKSQIDTDDGIDKFLPSLPPNANKPYILITSRNQAWGNEPLKLDTFTESESEDFIKKALLITDESQEVEIKNLAETLQHFPLALQQAVAYINEKDKEFKNFGSKFEISDYLKRYVEETKNLLNFEFPGDSIDTYTITTFKTWKITTEKIKEIDKQAGEILDIIAYFAPDSIPVEIFLKSEITGEKESLSKAVELLKKYSMVNSGKVQTVLNVHRLVQQVTRIKLEGKGKNEEIIEKAFEILTEKFPYGEITSKEYSKKMELLPHLEIFLSHIDKWQAKNSERKQQIEKNYLISLLSMMGEGYFYQGNSNRQKELFERTLAIKEKYYGPDHFQVAITLTNLGNAYGTLGDSQKKKQLLERALAIQEKYYGPDHFEVAIILTNLGVAYGTLGDSQKKKQLLERALAIKEKYYGPDHFEVAIILTNLGNAYGNLGDSQKKKQLLERALAIQEKYYGPDHFHVAIILTNLGVAYGNLGDSQKKKQLLERALAIQEKYYGPDHFHVAIILTNLGVAYGNLGDSQKKKQLLERALAIQEKYYEPDHFHVAITLTNLGVAYGNLGDIQKKKQLLERALAIEEKYYGPDHFQVAKTLGNLGVAYGDLGDTQKKKQLLERALAIQEKYYGLDNVNVAKTLLLLGNTHGDLGNTHKCKELLEQALSIFERHNHYLVTKVRTILDEIGTLHFACRNANLDMVKNLVEEGSDVLARNNHDTVLHQAVGSGNVEVIRLIVEKIKEKDPQKIYEHINAKDSEGDTPLMLAAQMGKTNAAKILLEYEVDLNVQNSDGETALHWAVEGGYQEFVKILLDKKADPNIKDKDKNTPLNLAHEKLDQDPENDDFKTIIGLLLSITDESSAPRPGISRFGVVRRLFTRKKKKKKRCSS